MEESNYSSAHDNYINDRIDEESIEESIELEPHQLYPPRFNTGLPDDSEELSDHEDSPTISARERVTIVNEEINEMIHQVEERLERGDFLENDDEIDPIPARALHFLDEETSQVQVAPMESSSSQRWQGAPDVASRLLPTIHSSGSDDDTQVSRGPASPLLLPTHTSSGGLFPSPSPRDSSQQHLLQRRHSGLGRYSSQDRDDLLLPGEVDAMTRRSSFSPENSLDSIDSYSTPVSQEKLEARMLRMRRRFESLKALNEIETAANEDMYNATLGTDLSPANGLKGTMELTPPSNPASGGAEAKRGSGGGATKNWKTIRRMLAPTMASIVDPLVALAAREAASSFDQQETKTGHEVGHLETLRSANVDSVTGATATEELPDSSTFIDYWKQIQVTVPDLEAFTLETHYPLDEEELRLGEPTGPAAYLDEFEASSSAALVELLSVPETVLQAKREEMEAVYAAEQRRAAEQRMKQEADLVWREHGARLRIRDLETDMLRKVSIEKQKLAEVAAEREQLLSWQFRRAREVLEDGLVRQEAEVKERFGTLGSDAAARVVDVMSANIPHPVEMRIHLLRAVKNKLSKGAYLLMLTQYDRLGGLPLKWSKLGSFGMGPDKPGVTRPIKHYGRYFDRAMKVEDSVFALCPPRNELKPSYVFVIELFRLANRRNPKEDSIVGWSVLPMCLENLGIVEGRYKLPMLRGQHTSSTEHFRDIDKAIAADLNNWLCNIYFEIRHLPQSLLEAKSEVHYSFIQKNLHAKAAGKNGYLNEILYDSVPSKDSKSRKKSMLIKDGEAGASNKKTDMPLDIEQGGASGLEPIDGGGPPAPQRKKSILEGLPFHGLFTRKSSRDVEQEEGVQNPLREGADIEAGREEKSPDDPNRGSDSEEDDEEVIEKGYNSADDFFLHPEVRGKLAGRDAVLDGADRAWATLSVNECRESKVIRRHQSDGSRYDSLAINPPQIILDAEAMQGQHTNKRSIKGSMPPEDMEMHRGMSSVKLPQQPSLHSVAEHAWPVLDSEKELESYSPALVRDPAQKKKIIPSEIVRSKLRYLMCEIFDGFSLADRWTLDFYVAVFVMLAALWIRMFIHFLGQYLTLQGMRVPVFGFTVFPYLISFKYMSSGLSVSEEVLVVVSGPLFNVAFFLCLELASIFIFRYVGHLPENASRFVVSYGFCTVFDPLFVMLVDVFAHNYDCSNSSILCRENYVSSECSCYEGDFVKLWNRFKREESSGVVGAIIVVILYVGTCTLSSFLLYEYLMHVHKDARILDMWRRVTGNEEEFLLPHDFEISYEELLRICGERMSRWRGLDGAKRRLEVNTYVEEDSVDAAYSKNTVHYAVYEYSADNTKRKLHRHFLMLPDGAIIEIFDKYQGSTVQNKGVKGPPPGGGGEVLVSEKLIKSYKMQTMSVKNSKYA